MMYMPHVFGEGNSLTLVPQLGLRLFAVSNNWNVNGKPQICKENAQEC